MLSAVFIISILTEKPNNTPEPEPTNTPVSKLYLGDAVEKFRYVLRSISVQYPTTHGNFYEVDTKLVAVEVIISNISENVLEVNPINATLVDSEGSTYPTTIGYVEGQIATLDLNPSERVRGLIAFQIPENSTPESINYSIERFDSKVVLQASLISPPKGA